MTMPSDVVSSTRDELIALLERLFDLSCERQTRGTCYDDPSNSEDSPYLATRVCNACQANKVLGRLDAVRAGVRT